MTESNEFYDFLLARQPIYDTESHLYGYELVFPDQDDPCLAATEVAFDETGPLVRLCASINRQYETLRQPQFLLVGSQFLLSQLPATLIPAAVVFELMVPVQVTSELLERIAYWRAKGFRFALCGFDFDLAYDPLLALVDFIKIDLLTMPVESMLARLRQLKRTDCRLIAEKVADKTTLIQCREAGFEFFQGYYLVVPDRVFGTRIRTNAHIMLQILNRIQAQDVSIEELSRIVANEPRLVYQLLRILNSPASRLRRRVESIRDAIVYLGLAQLKKWTLLTLLTANCNAGVEVLRLLLTRARACERYAQINGLQAAEKYFMAGLLSGIDLLLQVEKSVVMAHIRLEPDLQKAVLINEGPIGEVLNRVADVEEEEWASLGKLPVRFRRAVLIAHFEGGLWAHETLSALTSPD